MLDAMATCMCHFFPTRDMAHLLQLVSPLPQQPKADIEWLAKWRCGFRTAHIIANLLRTDPCDLALQDTSRDIWHGCLRIRGNWCGMFIWSSERHCIVSRRTSTSYLCPQILPCETAMRDPERFPGIVLLVCIPAGKCDATAKYASGVTAYIHNDSICFLTSGKHAKYTCR
jgi:hypothetical protein